MLVFSIDIAAIARQAQVYEKANLTQSIEYAGFWRRLAAFIIDLILMVVVILVFSFLISFVPGEIAKNIGGFVLMVGTFVALSLFECSHLQATPGKMILGIIVTDSEGNRVNFARALARNLGMRVSETILGMGYLMCIWTRKKQCLHDMIANCLVVRKQKV